MRPSGELDIVTAAKLAAELELARRSGLPVVVDLRQVEFMDATGLKVLLDARPLTLVCPSPQVYRLIEITGMRTLLPIVSDEAEAAA